MKILCLTHADFESPGIIKNWASDEGHDLKILRPYLGDKCLSEKEFDCLIIMGGPQSAVYFEDYAYLKDEILLIQEALQENKIVIGFCLGAQLIGNALNAPAEHSPFKEIGIFPIIITDKAIEDPLLKGFPKSFPVIHWHGDMPGLTKNAEILAHSEGCPRQIVRYDKKVYAFQCHLEITLEGMKEMVANCPEDLGTGNFIQDIDIMYSQDYESINKMMLVILNRLSELEN